MSQYAYSHLLDPDLYCQHCNVAQFLDAFRQPEIEELCDQALPYFVKMLPSMDKVIDMLESVEEEAQLKMEACHKPFFVACGLGAPIYLDLRHLERHIERAVSMCKSIVFVTGSPCAFYATQIPGANQIVIYGSSIRGHALKSVIEDDHIERTYKREIESNEFGHFYQIDDEDEMQNLLINMQHINSSRYISHPPCANEKAALVNFAITMKAITDLGYHQ